MIRAPQPDVDPGNPASVSPVMLEGQLERILASDVFVNAQRLSAFLRFVVERSARGEGDQIKEYLIGTEVFGRTSSYDPRTDPVVRVEAGRLRRKLEEYYRTQGSNDPVLIDLPKGRYVALIQLRNTKEPSAPRLADAPTLSDGPRPSTRRLVLITIVAIVVGVLASYFTYSRLASQYSPAAIAVLPFVNVSAGENQYLGDGVAEELTTGLAQLSGLRVVAATSAFQFRGKGEDVRKIGQQLNATALLEGSISRLPQGVRINAQLVSTQNGYHLWSKIYDVDAAGIFDAEADIVQQTARTLKVPLDESRNLRPANRETRDPEAHDLYLQGRYDWSKRDLASMEKAIALFQSAIRKDPNFALAYAALADTYVVMGGNGQKPLSEVVPPAQAALNRALELDPSLAEVHATLALLNSEASGQRSGLESELRRAVELSPGYANAHHWLGVILSGQARFEEANAELRTAQLLDPLTPIISEGVAENYYYWRRYDDAIAVSLQVQKMNSSIGDEVLGRAYVQKKMYDEADKIFRAMQQREDSPQAVTELAIVRAAAGHSDEARQLLTEIFNRNNSYVPPYWIAAVYAQLGEKDTAFSWLDRAYEQKDPMLGGIMVEPLFDSLHSDERYAELLKKADLHE